MSVRTLLRISAITLAVACMAGASVAYAQETLTMETSFAFRVGAAVHPPGKYQLSVTSNEEILTVTPNKGAATVAPIVTRLAASEPPSSGAKVIFDKAGDLYYLSEVWLPGVDGYLLLATKGKHTHVSVKIAKKG
jgi:hypothetical protein